MCEPKLTIRTTTSITWAPSRYLYEKILHPLVGSYPDLGTPFPAFKPCEGVKMIIPDVTLPGSTEHDILQCLARRRHGSDVGHSIIEEARSRNSFCVNIGGLYTT